MHCFFEMRIRKPLLEDVFQKPLDTPFSETRLTIELC
jgi:hypothetical protein